MTVSFLPKFVTRKSISWSLVLLYSMTAVRQSNTSLVDADLLRSLLCLILGGDDWDSPIDHSTLWSIPDTSMHRRLKSNERKRAKTDIRDDDDQKTNSDILRSCRSIPRCPSWKKRILHSTLHILEIAVSRTHERKKSLTKQTRELIQHLGTDSEGNAKSGQDWSDTSAEIEELLVVTQEIRLRPSTHTQNNSNMRSQEASRQRIAENNGEKRNLGQTFNHYFRKAKIHVRPSLLSHIPPCHVIVQEEEVKGDTMQTWTETHCAQATVSPSSRTLLWYPSTRQMSLCIASRSRHGERTNIAEPTATFSCGGCNAQVRKFTKRKSFEVCARSNFLGRVLIRASRDPTRFRNKEICWRCVSFLSSWSSSVIPHRWCGVRLCFHFCNHVFTPLDQIFSALHAWRIHSSLWQSRHFSLQNSPRSPALSTIALHPYAVQTRQSTALQPTPANAGLSRNLDQAPWQKTCAYFFNSDSEHTNDNNANTRHRRQESFRNIWTWGERGRNTTSTAIISTSCGDCFRHKKSVSVWMWKEWTLLEKGTQKGTPAERTTTSRLNISRKHVGDPLTTTASRDSPRSCQVSKGIKPEPTTTRSTSWGWPLIPCRRMEKNTYHFQRASAHEIYISQQIRMDHFHTPQVRAHEQSLPTKPQEQTLRRHADFKHQHHRNTRTYCHSNPAVTKILQTTSLSLTFSCQRHQEERRPNLRKKSHTDKVGNTNDVLKKIGIMQTGRVNKSSEHNREITPQGPRSHEWHHLTEKSIESWSVDTYGRRLHESNNTSATTVISERYPNHTNQFVVRTSRETTEGFTPATSTTGICPFIGRLRTRPRTEWIWMFWWQIRVRPLITTTFRQRLRV